MQSSTSHFSYPAARTSSDPTLQPRGAPRHGVRPPASGCARQPQLRGIRLRAACALPLPYCRRPGRACGATRACWARANRCAFLSAARRALTWRRTARSQAYATKHRRPHASRGGRCDHHESTDVADVDRRRPTVSPQIFERRVCDHMRPLCGLLARRVKTLTLAHWHGTRDAGPSMSSLALVGRVVAGRGDAWRGRSERDGSGSLAQIRVARLRSGLCRASGCTQLRGSIASCGGSVTSAGRSHALGAAGSLRLGAAPAGGRLGAADGGLRKTAALERQRGRPPAVNGR